MTEIPKIEIFYITAPNLVPVSYDQVIKEKIVCHWVLNINSKSQPLDHSKNYKSCEMKRRKIRGHEHVMEVILHGLISLTEMCIAICQPGSDHFLKHPSRLHVSVVCVHRTAGHTELEVMALEDRITLPLLEHFEITQFLFCYSSLPFNQPLKSNLFQDFILTGFCSDSNTELKTLKIM